MTLPQELNETGQGGNATEGQDWKKIQREKAEVLTFWASIPLGSQ